MLHEGDGNVLLCDACNGRTCVTCMVVFHDGRTCREFGQEMRRRDGDSAASLQLIERVCSRCPKCRWPIEKAEGCDHMTCRCGHQFCYRCLADYGEIRRQGNRAHRPTCHYHRF